MSVNDLTRDDVPQPPLVAKALRRDHDEAVAQVADRLGVFIAEGQAHQVRRAPCRAPVDGCGFDRHQSAWSAQTIMDLNAAGPKVVSIATSRASRPRPINTRPTRRALLRGSNGHHREPGSTSIPAAKSTGG